MAGSAAYGGVKMETWWVWGIQAVVKMGLMGFIGFARFLDSLGGYDFDDSSDFLQHVIGWLLPHKLLKINK